MAVPTQMTAPPLAIPIRLPKWSAMGAAEKAPTMLPTEYMEKTRETVGPASPVLKEAASTILKGKEEAARCRGASPAERSR